MEYDITQLEKDVEKTIDILQAQGFRLVIPEYKNVISYLGLKITFESDFEALLYFGGIYMGIQASKPDFFKRKVE